MAKSYKRFNPGDKFTSFPGGSWNRMTDAAKWVDGEKARLNPNDNDTPGKQSLVASVRNDSGEDQDAQFPILGIKSPIVEVADDDSILHRDAQLNGEKPDPAKHAGKFCVFQAPVEEDAVSTAVVKGYTIARVEIRKKSHTTCGIKEDDTEKLTSGLAGANIVWAEKANTEGEETGEQWCLVDVNPATPMYYLTSCTDPSDTKLVSNDLGDMVGKVVMVNSICYEVDYPPEDNECQIGECVTVQSEFEGCEECISTGNCCWLLTSCETGSFIIKDCDFGKYNGLTVKWSDDKCYTVSKSPLCTGWVDGGVDDVKESYGDCLDCNSCVELESCCDGSTLFVPSDTLSIWQKFVDNVVKVNGTCYTVIDPQAACSGFEVPAKTNGVVYGDCTDCGCYVFQRCSHQSPPGTKVVCKATYASSGQNFDLNQLGFGDVVTLGSENNPECWERIDPETPPDCTVSEDIVILDVYSNCQCCSGFELVRCSPNDTDKVYTQNPDICQYMNDAFTGIQAGLVLKRADEDGFCFDQINPVAIGAAETWEEFLVDTEHQGCAQCEDPVYSLTDIGCKFSRCLDCADGAGWTEDVRYTDQDLSSVVDKIIKYDGTCWHVNEAPGETVTDYSPISWTGPFEECEPCAQKPMCVEVVVDIDWENKKVIKKTYTVPGLKCGESEDTIPTGTCPDP